ncbi:hypothetical protein WISP_81866 [Willisornis vidua]|uniref:Uncharacterized protein n=1 Tax=Willisornis vidua TaxID=1566151 RepID=A0ABQ9D767_9PASS|nr:hypothetical protein WISP_81866 [Willisornis vidua]
MVSEEAMGQTITVGKQKRSVKDVGPLRSVCLRPMEAVLLKDLESEEVMNTNKRNIDVVIISSYLKSISEIMVSMVPGYRAWKLKKFKVDGPE